MGLRLGELTAFLKIGKKDFSKDLVEAKAEFRAAGQSMAREADKTGKAMGVGFHHGASGGIDRFFRDATGRLHDERGRFVRDFEQMGEAAGGAASGGFSMLFSSIGDIGKALAGAAGPLKIFAIGLLIAVGAATFLGPAIGAVAAALAILPALAFGAAAGVATLVLGFMGIADHFKKTAKAGGSVVDKAFQIAQAERRVRDANEEVTASQKALNQAREDAVERMQDLNRSLAGSRLDQHAATLALTDAQKQLDAAQASGNADEIERAQLAYDQAAQSLAEVNDRVEDLTLEQRRSARAGVEGSDQVQSALLRQRAAVEGVADAEHALREARKGGGGGSPAEELTKIAPAAQAAVDAIKGLKPAWDKLRLSVQQRLFSGVAGELKDLSKAWLPTLTTKLGAFADTFNHIFKVFSGTAKKPEFIEKVGKALDAVNRFIDKIGAAAAGPFMDAMATLGEAAAPILDMLGDDIAKGFFEDFAKWIDSGAKSGKLQSFLDQASGFLHDVLHMGKTVVGIVGDITDILFGSETDGVSSWQSVLNSLDDLKAWLDDPANKKKASEWIERFQAMGIAILKVIGFLLKVGLWLYDAERAFDRFLEASSAAAARFVAGAKEKLTSFVGWLGGLPGRVASATAGMFDGIKDAFKAALNWVIDRWNGLKFKLPEGEIFGQKIGGATLSVPPIPHLAGGGIVPATPGGRLVRTSEAGEAEAVMPLSKLAPMLRDAVMQALATVGELGSRVIELTLDLGEGIRQVVQVHLDRQGRHTVRVVGMARGR